MKAPEEIKATPISEQVRFEDIVENPEEIFEQPDAVEELETEGISEQPDAVEEPETEEIFEQPDAVEELETEEISEQSDAVEELETEKISEQMDIEEEPETEAVSEQLNVEEELETEAVSEQLNVEEELETEEISEQTDALEELEAEKISEQMDIEEEPETEAVSEQLNVEEELEAEEVSGQPDAEEDNYLSLLQEDSKSSSAQLSFKIEQRESTEDDIPGQQNFFGEIVGKSSKRRGNFSFIAEIPDASDYIDLDDEEPAEDAGNMKFILDETNDVSEDVIKTEEEDELKLTIASEQFKAGLEDDQSDQISEEVAEVEEILDVAESACDTEEDEAEEISEEIYESQDTNDDTSVSDEYNTAEEISTTETQTESFDGSNDIWDDDNRAEWAERDRFMRLCRTLTVPPIRQTKSSERIEPEKDDANPKSSGYRYEMVERLPFDEGLTIEDKESYMRREKNFCDERAIRHGKMLRDKMRVSSGRFLAVAVLLFFTLTIDALNLVRISGEKFINADNIVYLGGIQALLVIMSAVILFNCIKDSIKCLAGSVVIPEFLVTLSVIFAVAYNICLSLIPGITENAVIIGSPAVFGVFLAALYRYNLLRRSVKVFEITSSYGSYCTEVKMSDFRRTPEYAEFEGYVPCESELYKINRVSRIDGCYNEQPIRDECRGLLRMLVICLMCVALCGGVVVGFVRQSIYDGVVASLLIWLMASPVSVLVALFRPRLKAAARAAEEGAAIIGFDDESREFDKNVIMLSDTDLFISEDAPKIEVRNIPDIERYLNRAACVFGKLGGTLGELFKSTGFEDRDDVAIKEISEHGVMASVGGTPFHAGTDKYMKKYGIKVHRYDGELGNDMRVMYIASGGVSFGRIIMRFSPDIELCKRISDLRYTNTVVSLKTCNPCIDRELVFFTTGLEPELLKVIKYNIGDDTTCAESDREGILVSSSGASGLLVALLEYKRQKKLISLANSFAGAVCVVGAVVALLVSTASTFGIMGVDTAVPLIATGYQGIVSVVAAIFSGRNVYNTKNKISKK